MKTLLQPSRIVSGPYRPEDESVTILGLHASHYNSFLWNYDFSDHAGLVDHIAEFVEGSYRRLILTGPPGIGKTHLSVGLFRRMVMKYDTVSCGWFTFLDIVSQVKKGFNDKTLVDPLVLIRDCVEFVCIDDVWGREMSPWEVENVLYPIIQIVHQNNARLVLTTNHDLDAISELLNPHELDRILDGATHIAMTGTSRRGNADR